MKRWLKGKVITPTEVIQEGVVCVDGQTLFYVGPRAIASRNLQDPIESVEGWITPGLIDLHLHGAGGANLMDGTQQAIATVGKTLLSHGVTAYLATGVVCKSPSENNYLEVIADLSKKQIDQAEILGIHVEGPYVSPVRGGLIRPDRIWLPDLGDLSQILKQSKGFLKMMTLAPELPGALSLIPRLSDAGVIGSIGHTDATYEETRRGFSSGLRHVTHLYNAMRGLHHREPGALGAILIDHGVTAQLIADGVHVHPDVLRWTAQVLSPEALVLISDALPSAGLPDGSYSYDGRSYESKNGSAFYRPGTPEKRLFGTTLLLDNLVNRAVDFMGVTFAEAVRMASFNPARALGVEKHRGSLAKGMRADLVCWDDQGHVMETILRGETVWKRERSSALC